jgi:hypothetical protein
MNDSRAVKKELFSGGFSSVKIVPREILHHHDKGARE